MSAYDSVYQANNRYLYILNFNLFNFIDKKIKYLNFQIIY